VGAAVVTGKYNERIFGSTAFLQSFQNLSDNGIRLHDKIGVEVQSALALPFVIY
jgi:hypothetical protein